MSGATDLAVLLYDWDNTLVDGWAGITAALNAVFDAFAMPLWTVADTRERVRVSLRDSFPVMFGAEWERARDIFYATLEAQHLHHVAPMPARPMRWRPVPPGRRAWCPTKPESSCAPR